MLIITGSMSCKRSDHKSKNNDFVGVIRLDIALKKKLPEQKLSDIAGAVHYIVFGGNKKFLFLHPSLAFVNKEYIILNDNRRYLYVCDKKGKLQWRLDRKGKGPGEYVQITDVEVDPDNHILYVLDESQLKIISYDLQAGKFIHEINIPVSSGAFALFRNGFVLWNPPWGFADKDYCYFLTFTGKSGKVLKHIDRYGNDNNFRGGILHGTWFCRAHGDLYIKDTYNDTVFRITKEPGLQPHAVLSCGKYTLPREKAEDVFFLQSHLNDYISQLYFLETPRYIFFKFLKGRYYLLVYDKQLKGFISKSEGTLNQPATFENDLDEGPDFDPWVVYGNTLYALVPLTAFQKHPVAGIKVSEKDFDPAEEGNAVLVAVELK